MTGITAAHVYGLIVDVVLVVFLIGLWWKIAQTFGNKRR